MNIRFKNVHTKRYRALAFVLSLTVLLSGLVWYGVAQSNQKVEAVYPSREIVYVDTDFYDYYNDAMVTGNGTGSEQGNLKRPFRYLNEAISNYARTNGWNYPLYFGQFWRADDENYYKGSNAKSQTSYNNSEFNAGGFEDYGKSLYNFVWAANLAFRSSDYTEDKGYTGSTATPQFYAVAQGLVNGSSTDSKGNLVPTSNGVNLPYFDEDFLDKTYDGHKVGTVYDNKSYPFYATSESVKIGTQYSGNYTPGGSIMEQFGPGYQFDSSKNGVYVNSSGRVAAGTNTIYDIDHYRKSTDSAKKDTFGFFPFNSNSESITNGSQLNYGFGVKYSINFQMNENGTTDGEEWSGEHGTSEDNRAYFTFRGDDDVWVFIDNELVLDMGGAHKQAEGYIDFNSKKSGVLFSANVGDYLSNDSNIRVSKSAIKKSEKDLSTTFEKLHLDDGKEHTLTMFYMERGMLNSNLFVQFNMPVDPSEDMLTITDKVSVAGVNDGLKSQTLAIADSDVVNYTVSNKGTKPSEVHDTGLLYPGSTVIRRYNREYFNTHPTGGDVNENYGQTVLLADGSGYAATTQRVFDRGHIYIDFSKVSSWWFTDAVTYVYTFGGTGGTKWTPLGSLYSCGNDIYRMDYNGTFKNIIVARVNPSRTGDIPNNINWNNNGTFYNLTLDTPTNSNISSKMSSNVNCFNILDTKEDNNGFYKNRTSDGAAQYTTQVTRPSNQSDKKYLNEFASDVGFNSSIAHAVATTNYELIDPKAQRKNTGSTSVTRPWLSYATSSTAEQTSSSGALNLMYDQSAVFTGQFTVGSEMQIKQSDTLYKPSVNSSTQLPTYNTSSRTLGTYYNISEPELEYGSGTSGGNPTAAVRGSDGTDTFKFNDVNKVANDNKVQIEAIYTREVKTGSISVEKKLADGSKSTADEFTMQVEITNVFGSAGWSVDDYSGLVIDGSSASTGNTVDSNGTFKMKAGDTVTISGIPVGTVVTITESGFGKYWTQQTITPNTNIKVTEGPDHKVTVTNKRLTGELILSKAFGSNVTETADRSQTFAFKVTLQSAKGEVFDWDYWKDLITVDSSQVNLTYVGDPMSDTATFEVTGITANASKTVKGIPYGVKYTVDEVVPNGWTKTKTEIEQDGTTDKKDSDVFDHEQETVKITNEKKVIQTGTLTIEKALNSNLGTLGYDDHGFPIKIIFRKGSSSSVTLDDLDNSNITYKVGSGQSKSLTIIPDGTTARVAWVKVSKNEPVTVEGVPVGIQYNVYEEDVSEDYGKVVSELAGLKAGNWTNNVTSDNASHTFRRGTSTMWVNFEGDETVTVENTPNLGNLKISKVITDPQPGDDDIEFEAVVTLALPDGYDPAVHKFTKDVAGVESEFELENVNGQKGTITITFSKGTPCTIRNVPIGTIWELTEKPQEGWTCEKVEYLTTNNQLTLDQGVMPIPREYELSPDDNTFWNPQSAGTLNKLKYNKGSSSSTTTTREIQVTNKRVAAYLTIEKYIDKLYYAENDNPHNFPASIGVGTKSPPEDPHGYLGYTEAEQSFVFKVDKYALNADLGLSPQLAPISTSYVVLKFGKDSTRINPVSDTTDTSYYYTDSTTVKVEPGFIYKVTELGVENGLGWRYDFASSAFATDDGDNIIATFNAAPFTSGANNGIEVKYKNTVKDLAEATVTFYNKRNETDNKDIESDMSSIKNTIKVEKS